MAIKKEVDLVVNAESVKNLKTQLREAQQEVAELANKFGDTSKEAVNAAKKAAELKDKIGDAKALTDAFNPDAKFRALTSSLSGAAAGFTAVQGAMGLFGNESENVQKTLLKVQSAMALSQSLQQLGEAKDSFKQLGAVVKNVFTGIKGAIAASGIGLLLIALGTLYNYWGDIKEAVSGVSEEQKKLNVQVAHNLELENNKLDKINNQDNVLKLQGKSEKEILGLKIKQIDAVILATEAQIEQDKITKKAQVDAAKRNHDYLKGFLDFITLPTKKLTEYFAKFVNMASDVLGKVGIKIDKYDLKAIEDAFNKTNEKLANYIFDPKETAAEGDKVIKEHQKTIDKLKNDKAGLQLDIQKIDKEASDKAKQNAKDLADENYKNYLREKELRESEMAADAAVYEYFAELDRKAAEEKEALRQQELADEQLAADMLEKIRLKQLADERDAIAQKKLLRQQEFNAVQDTFTTIANLAELFSGKTRKQQKAAFQVQKAANIANATMDTYKAATGAYASLSGVPVVGPALGAAAAGVAVSAGLLNVKRIASQQFESTSTSSGGSGGGSVPSTSPSTQGGVIAPTFNVNSGTTNQLNTLQQQPIQAYVVSGQVTSAQALDRNRIKNATL